MRSKMLFAGVLGSRTVPARIGTEHLAIQHHERHKIHRSPPLRPQPTVPSAMAQDTAASDNNTPITKRELKDQRKEQKQDEKSARENAKDQKDNAKALKHQDKPTDAAEKANSPK